MAIAQTQFHIHRIVICYSDSNTRLTQASIIWYKNCITHRCCCCCCYCCCCFFVCLLAIFFSISISFIHFLYIISIVVHFVPKKFWVVFHSMPFEYKYLLYYNSHWWGIWTFWLSSINTTNFRNQHHDYATLCLCACYFVSSSAHKSCKNVWTVVDTMTS